MRRLRIPLAILATFGLLLPAAADEGGGTTVSVDAPGEVAVGEALPVTGAVSFGMAVMDDVFATEGSSDVPGGDIVGGSITSDPDVPDAVTFAIEIGNMPPVIGAIPEGIIYGWELSVNGEPYGGGSSANIDWRRTNLTGAGAADAPPPSPDGFLTVRSCVPNPDTGGNTCGSNFDVVINGGFFPDDGEIRGTLRVGDGEAIAQPGDTIDMSMISVYQGTGLLWLTLNSDEAFTDDDFTVPGRADSVRIGLVPAGEEAVYSTAVTPDGEGAEGTFTVDLETAGLSAGDYDVVTEACWGDNCGTARTPVALTD